MTAPTLRNLVRAARPSEQMARTVVVPADTLDRLQADADARGITVNVLVRDLLAEIGDSKLVTAILDDVDDTGSVMQ